MKRKAIFEIIIDVDKNANPTFEHLSKMIINLNGSSTGAHREDNYIFKVDKVIKIK